MPFNLLNTKIGSLILNGNSGYVCVDLSFDSTNQLPFASLTTQQQSTGFMINFPSSTGNLFIDTSLANQPYLQYVNCMSIL
jgi:hypothetical protein